MLKEIPHSALTYMSHHVCLCKREMQLRFPGSDMICQCLLCWPLLPSVHLHDCVWSVCELELEFFEFEVRIKHCSLCLSVYLLLFAMGFKMKVCTANCNYSMLCLSIDPKWGLRSAWLLRRTLQTAERARLSRARGRRAPVNV